MAKLCDVCGEREATIFDRALKNNESTTYAYCEACYTRLVKNGVNPRFEVDRMRDFHSTVCKDCGTTAREADEALLFGCPECYANMRGHALKMIEELQGATRHVGKALVPFDLSVRNRTAKYSQDDIPIFAYGADVIKRIFGQNDFVSSANRRFKSADECTEEELTSPFVISSRVRLARNVKGLPFPRKMDAHNFEDEISGAYLASKGIFDARVRKISALSKSQLKALIERHIVSLPLANNTELGAVIVDGGSTGFSVMINEEDHFREQCVVDGFNLKEAYRRLYAYDTNLMKCLPIAYDEQLGFLTACPTNVGTGMRASVMVFLPALSRAGAVNEALDVFKKRYGLTIRGVFGEGSDSVGDVYQISNSWTLGLSEKTIVGQVEEAVVSICRLERIALEKLLLKEGKKMLDELTRSYYFLTSANTLEYQEFSAHVSNLKLGAVLGVLPKKLSPSQIDKLVLLCSPSSLEIAIKTRLENPSILRAEIVRAVLTEER